MIGDGYKHSCCSLIKENVKIPTCAIDLRHGTDGLKTDGLKLQNNAVVVRIVVVVRE